MIKHLHIRNFKSLRDVQVDLEPVTVLIGRSGTGKTNFFYALRFLREFLANRNTQCVTNWGGWTAIFCVTAAKPALSIEVTFSVPGIDADCRYLLGFRREERHEGFDLSEERLFVQDTTVFHHRDGKWLEPPKVVDVPKVEAKQPALGAVYGIPEARVAHTALTLGLACYDFPGEVLRGGSLDRTKGSALDDTASNYLAALDAIESNLAEPDSIKEMLAGLQRLNRTIASVQLAMDRSHIVVSHQVGNGKVLSFRLPQESEGLRRFLAYLIALYQQPPRLVLAFEEPEKGIYPGALAVLAEYFQSVADRGRSQVILTTHSPELLRHFKPEQIRVVELDGYDTKIGPMASDQREALEEHLLTADELLTVDEPRISTASGPASES